MDLFTIAGKLTVDSAEFTKKLEQAQSKGEQVAQSLSRAMEKIGKATAFATVAATTGLAAFFVKMGQVGFAYNRQIEEYTANFKVMLGSTEKALARIEELKALAQKSPLTLEDYAQGTQQLLAYNVAANETNEILSMLGDIAMGDRQKFQSLAVNIGQISSLGKLQAQDMKQLAMAGFNPLNLIIKRTGETYEEAEKRMSAGLITFAELKQAMKDATSEGGMYYKGAEEGAKTVTGQLSTLDGKWNDFLGKLMEPVNLEVGNSILPALSRGLDKITEALFGVQGASNTAKEALFTDADGNEISPSSNLQTWFTELMRVWTDGKPEDDAIVRGFVDDYKANTLLIENELQRRIDSLGLTEEERREAEEKKNELLALNAEVEQLLWKRQNKTITPEEETRLQTILARIAEIEAGLGTTAAVDEKVLSPWEQFVQKLGGMATDGIDSLATLIADFLSDPEKLNSTITKFSDALDAIPGIAKNVAKAIELIVWPMEKLAEIVGYLGQQAPDRVENNERGTQADFIDAVQTATVNKAGTENALDVVGWFFKGDPMGKFDKGQFADIADEFYKELFAGIDLASLGYDIALPESNIGAYLAKYFSGESLDEWANAEKVGWDWTWKPHTPWTLDYVKPGDEYAQHTPWTLDYVKPDYDFEEAMKNLGSVETDELATEQGMKEGFDGLREAITGLAESIQGQDINVSLNVSGQKISKATSKTDRIEAVERKRRVYMGLGG